MVGVRDDDGMGGKRRREERWGHWEHTSFRLTTTGASAAVVASPFAVVGCAGFDSDDFAVCLCRGSLGDATCVAIAGKSHRQKSREEEFDTGNHDGQKMQKRRNESDAGWDSLL